jgi:hypothetical protein
MSLIKTFKKVYEDRTNPAKIRERAENNRIKRAINLNERKKEIGIRESEVSVAEREYNLKKRMEKINGAGHTPSTGIKTILENASKTDVVGKHNYVGIPSVLGGVDILGTKKPSDKTKKRKSRKHKKSSHKKR